MGNNQQTRLRTRMFSAPTIPINCSPLHRDIPTRTLVPPTSSHQTHFTTSNSYYTPPFLPCSGASTSNCSRHMRRTSNVPHPSSDYLSSDVTRRMSHRISSSDENSDSEFDTIVGNSSQYDDEQIDILIMILAKKNIPI
ncbi:hypothetical protein RYX36_026832 [Vicia faba]